MRKRRKLINITKERREEREKKKSVEKRVRGKSMRKHGGKVWGKKDTFYNTIEKNLKNTIEKIIKF